MNYKHQIIALFSTSLLIACGTKATSALTSANASANSQQIKTTAIQQLELPDPFKSFQGTESNGRDSLPGLIASFRANAVAACAASLGMDKAAAANHVRFDGGQALRGTVGMHTGADAGSVCPVGGTDSCPAVQIDADGCSAALYKDFSNKEANDWGVYASCPAIWCSAAVLTDLGYARFGNKTDFVEADGPGFVSLPNQALTAGKPMILDVRSGELGNFVSRNDTEKQTLATQIHMNLRFDSGAFRELPGLKGLSVHKGSELVSPGYDGALVVIDVPASAQRLEVYARFEVWNYESMPVHDTAATLKIKDRAQDGYVSNSGQNYVLPVGK